MSLYLNKTAWLNKNNLDRLKNTTYLSSILAKNGGSTNIGLEGLIGAVTIKDRQELTDLLKASRGTGTILENILKFQTSLKSSIKIMSSSGFNKINEQQVINSIKSSSSSGSKFENFPLNLGSDKFQNPKTYAEKIMKGEEDETMRLSLESALGWKYVDLSKHAIGSVLDFGELVVDILDSSGSERDIKKSFRKNSFGKILGELGITDYRFERVPTIDLFAIEKSYSLRRYDLGNIVSAMASFLNADSDWNTRKEFLPLVTYLAMEKIIFLMGKAVQQIQQKAYQKENLKRSLDALKEMVLTATVKYYGINLEKGNNKLEKIFFKGNTKITPNNGNKMIRIRGGANSIEQIVSANNFIFKLRGTSGKLDKKATIQSIADFLLTYGGKNHIGGIVQKDDESEKKTLRKLKDYFSKLLGQRKKTSEEINDIIKNMKKKINVSSIKYMVTKMIGDKYNNLLITALQSGVNTSSDEYTAQILNQVVSKYEQYKMSELNKVYELIAVDRNFYKELRSKKLNKNSLDKLKEVYDNGRMLILASLTQSQYFAKAYRILVKYLWEKKRERINHFVATGDTTKNRIGGENSINKLLSIDKNDVRKRINVSKIFNNNYLALVDSKMDEVNKAFDTALKTAVSDTKNNKYMKKKLVTDINYEDIKSARGIGFKLKKLFSFGGKEIDFDKLANKIQKEVRNNKNNGTKKNNNKKNNNKKNNKKKINNNNGETLHEVPNLVNNKLEYPYQSKSFWIKLRAALRGRGILIPFMGSGVRISDGLVDVMKSAINGSLTNASILNSKDFSQSNIEEKMRPRYFVLVSDEKERLTDPKYWRALDEKVLLKLKKARGVHDLRKKIFRLLYSTPVYLQEADLFWTNRSSMKKKLINYCKKQKICKLIVSQGQVNEILETAMKLVYKE